LNAGDSTSVLTVGIVLSSSIGANQKGLIMMQGLLDGLSILPTSTWADGDPVYLGDTAGTITKTKPAAPKHLVYLGVVTTASNGSAGRMYVRVQNGYELEELHNVSITSPTNNQLLQYESSTSLWKNKTIDKSTVGLGNVDNTSDASKPVSTAQQTALDLKLNKSKYISVGYTQVTGVTSQTVLASLKIPAGTYVSGESFEVIVTPNKSVTASSVSFNVYHATSVNGTTNAICTAISLSTTQRTGYLMRALTIDGTTLRNSMPASSSGITPIAGIVVGATTTFNPAVDNWITVTVNPSVVSESAGCNQITIRPL